MTSLPGYELDAFIIKEQQLTQEPGVLQSLILAWKKEGKKKSQEILWNSIFSGTPIHLLTLPKRA